MTDETITHNFTTDQAGAVVSLAAMFAGTREPMALMSLLTAAIWVLVENTVAPERREGVLEDFNTNFRGFMNGTGISTVEAEHNVEQ